MRRSGVSAEPLLQRAIELDPGFAEAYAFLAWAYVVRFFSTGRTELLDEAFRCAQTALALDNGDAWCHWALGVAYMFMHRLESAGPHFERAVALNPTDVHIAASHAHWLSRMGRTREALDKLDDAVRRDPFMPDWFWEVRSVSLLQEKRYAEVIEAVHHMRRLWPWNHCALAIAYAHLGRLEEANAHAAEVLRLKPDYSKQWVIVQEPYKNPADLEHVLDGPSKAGLPD